MYPTIEPLMESTVEDVLMHNPSLLRRDLVFVEKREKISHAGIIDLVFKDSQERMVLVEVKRGSATRQDIGQVLDYFGSLKQENPEAEIIFVANEIKDSFKVALSMLNIDYREVKLEHKPIAFFTQASALKDNPYSSTPSEEDSFVLERVKDLYSLYTGEKENKKKSIPSRALKAILLEAEAKYGVCVCDVIEGGCREKYKTA